jgi:hypothetical protein
VNTEGQGVLCVVWGLLVLLLVLQGMAQALGAASWGWAEPGGAIARQQQQQQQDQQQQ